MAKVKLKSASEDMLIRDPETGKHLSTKGEMKEMSTYWTRRIQEGVVVDMSKAEAPAPEEATIAPEAPAPEEATIAPEAPAPEEATKLSDMTKAQLQEIAAAHGIEYKPKDTNNALIEKITDFVAKNGIIDGEGAEGAE